jgi:hypothetical protein
MSQILIDGIGTVTFAAGLLRVDCLAMGPSRGSPDRACQCDEGVATQAAGAGQACWPGIGLQRRAATGFFSAQNCRERRNLISDGAGPPDQP